LGEVLSHFLFLQPWARLDSRTTETWDRVPSLADLYVYYNLVQITQQRELNVGCYSSEFWTSINPYVPPFAQPSETQHAIREIYWPAVTEPHHRAYYKNIQNKSWHSGKELSAWSHTSLVRV
jgi:hypothetical protein